MMGKKGNQMGKEGGARKPGQETHLEMEKSKREGKQEEKLGMYSPCDHKGRR